MEIEEIKEKIIGTILLQEGKICGEISDVSGKANGEDSVEILFHANGFPLFVHAAFEHKVLENLASTGFSEAAVEDSPGKTTNYHLLRKY